MSDRIVPPGLAFIASYGIIGLYVSVVLVISRFLRLSASNISHKIIYQDMPQVQTLANLCELVRLARSRVPPQLDLEESLYRLLIRLYRSPEALLTWTDPALV